MDGDSTVNQGILTLAEWILWSQGKLKSQQEAKKVN